eukprot:TRINITY_DN4562_c0_g1_i1.p1 TRINITY_DN4562_c0_g1~~TRINITY_DN4562_c0_g1_i1.p1  ORF type:complete len:556 (+),score=69.45 TRINITY_DN4562_c0_g1_i1:184-1851(+)
MGHRHFFGTSQIFETDHDQNRPEPHMHLGGARSLENGSFSFPVENMNASGVNLVSHRNLAPRSNDYPSSSLSPEIPNYRPTTSGTPYDPYLHTSSAISFCPAPATYAQHAPSSSYYRHSTIHGDELSTANPSMGNGRELCKRKNPAISTVYERGITGRYNGAGSSSDSSVSSDFLQQKPDSGSQFVSWEPIGIAPNYRGNSQSIAGEGSHRNVRSRPSLHLESNLGGTNISSNLPLHFHSTGRTIDRSGLGDLTVQNSHANTRGWSHFPVSPPTHGRILPSDNGGLNHEANQFTNCSVPMEIGGYHNPVSSRIPGAHPQNFHAVASEATRGVRGRHAQRTVPAYRAISSYPHLGHISTPSDAGMQSGLETYPSSRYSRSLSASRARNSDRNGRARISYDRLLPHSDEADMRDYRLMSEGFMIMDRSAFYDSRSMIDQHRDMRLDIDNMSYEELLALEERIGSVNTGLSDDMISKCLLETVICSLDSCTDGNQEEGSCIICLEEYQNKEELGTLMNCGHDYHAGCIKKWLSVKNACPICKAPALSDMLKEKSLIAP